MRRLDRIQKEVLTGYHSWNEEDFEAVCTAVSDVYRASRIARRQGLLALEDFETESKFFQWALSIVTDGIEPEYFEELLENRYFTGQLNDIEKRIYYVYARGSLLLQQGLHERLMQEFLVSIVPEPYRNRISTCISSDRDKEEQAEHVYREAEKIAKEFFESQDLSVLSAEEQHIKYQFDTIFQSMPDRSIQRVLREIETCVFEAAVLYAEEATRIRIRTNVSHKLYRCIVEDWQSMFNDYKRSIDSMQSMLAVCKRLRDSGEIIVPEVKGAPEFGVRSGF